ncbi:MAG: T9SS type A sorting domain-containing protein [Bacteroidetes bacterium]|nr:T9SS type A sorting domain-containing protein [Bacteroidota bacterium]
MKLLITFIFLSNAFLGQTWTQLADLPATERDDGVAVHINNKAYFGTGLLAGFTLGRDFYAYDLSANTWSAIASMPTGSERQYATVFTHLNSFYVLSGAGYSNAVFTDLQRYDVATDSWTALTGKPGNGLIGASCLEYGNKIIIVGGKFQSGVVSDEVWEYTISSNTWVQKNNFPFGGRWRASASVLNGVGYLMFGKDNNQSFRKEMYSYNYTTDTWTKVMDFPQPKGRAYSALKASTTQLVLFAGYDTLNTYYNDVWYYNPFLVAWSAGPNLPAAGRKGGMSCIAGDKFYYSCGINVSDVRLKETWMIDVPVEIKENYDNNIFVVYPNPINDKIYFNFSRQGNYTIELMDVSSKLILKQTLSNSNRMDVSVLEKGIYFLIIFDGIEQVGVKKIIKE